MMCTMDQKKDYRNVRVDMEVYRLLEQSAKGYESRNNTLRRLLGLAGSKTDQPNTKKRGQ